VKKVEQERPVTARTRFAGWLISSLVRLLYGLTRLTIEREGEVEALIREHGGVIFVTWHGRTLLPVGRFRGRGYWALISLSRDGDLQSENFRRLGWRVVRGSTGRRAVLATKQILAALAQPGAVLAFTPDGPRGPSNVVQPGVVYFAQKSGKPIVPAGISAHPRWLMKSWDRYLVPKPFARGVWLYGDPIFVTPEDQVEEVCRRVGEAIDALEIEAERRVGAPPREAAEAIRQDVPATAAEEAR